MKRLFSLFAAGAMSLAANALTIQQTQGWFESGCVKWSPVSGANKYLVWYQKSNTTKWELLDPKLVREYPDYFRADAVGLKEGTYKFRVDAFDGTTKIDSQETETFTATAYDRSGFAHVGMSEGIGAYKNDGTLKDNARVIYVWADNAKTVTCDVITSSNGTTTTGVGLQNIVYLYQKGYDTTPLNIRIIGTIKDVDMDSFGSSKEGLQVKGKDAYSEMPITIEGIGDDAAIWGFGILARNCKGTEFRNFAIMNCMDDCLSIDTDNSNIWIHNMDFFYGATGGDADQAKGDGTVDIKVKSTNVTVSYNHFYDAGKCSLGGMSGEISTTKHTYHHNWFDHSDSRHPRIRVQFFHVYNNYYDGVSKYGVGATTGNPPSGATIGGSALVEANYFRNTKYPMLISKQGTDAEGDGTFSDEPGGVIKAYNNTIVNAKQVRYNTGALTDGAWDAMLVTDRSAEITAVSLDGGYAYNNAADLEARTTYIENKMDAPDDVPAVVTGPLGAGRMNHGDFTWKFKNSAQDENDKVIADLKKAMLNYQSTLVGLADGTKISNGGATQPYVGGDGVGISDEDNNSYKPSWGTGEIYVDGVLEGAPVPTPIEEELFLSGPNENYFWFNEENEDIVKNELLGNVIFLSEHSSFNPLATVTKDGIVFYHTGSLMIAKETGSVTFYNENGISTIDLYLARTGDFKGYYEASKDGENYVELNELSGKAGEILPRANMGDNHYKYFRLTNTSTGTLHVQGVRLYQYATDKLQSDLNKTNNEDIVLNLTDNTTYQLSSPTDYTTSSTGSILYTSSRSKVAVVSSTGLITALGYGTTTIKLSQAADKDYQAGSLTFTVTIPDVRQQSQLTLLSPDVINFKLGDYEDDYIEVEGAVGEVSYTSSNTKVATVSADGLVRAVAPGQATITITDAGNADIQRGNLTVTVNVEPGTEEYILGSLADYFWFNEENETIIRNELLDNVIFLSEGTTFKATEQCLKDGVPVSDRTGSLKLAPTGGNVIFYIKNGIIAIDLYMARNGSFDGEFEASRDGINYEKLNSFDGAPGIKTINHHSGTSHYRYFKVINNSNGGLHIHGVKITQPAAGTLNESQLALLSPAKVSLNLEDNKTSQIEVEGAVGKVIYASSDPEVATVSADGQITAVGYGQATIVITDTGDDTTDAGTLKVEVIVAEGEAAVSEVIYEWATTGETTYSGAIVSSVKINVNQTSVDAVKFGSNTNYLKFAPESGGFKKGDIVTIAGCYTNDNSDTGYKLKINTDGDSKTTPIFTTETLVNGKTDEADPADETFVLDDDYDALYVMRVKGSTTYLTKLIVVRPGSEPTTIQGDVDADGDVDDDDVTLLEQILLEQKDATSGADVDNDGNVSIADMTRLIEILKEKK